MLAADRELLDPAVVGFKFARQARLRNDRFPVPPFCCVPGAVFDALVADIIAEHGDSPVGLTAAADMLAWADRMRARLVDRPVPPDLGAQLLERFDRIAGTDGVVAVRACAVAAADGGGEDGGTDPFAGLSDSFLNVRRDELLSRVAACWASGYSDRAVRYRMRRGVSPLSVSIAVGVQEMVPAERSFVAFTRDPVDGSDRCVIAAAHGYGEGVVQEKADLDHFYVDLAQGTVDRRAAVTGGPVLTDQEALGVAKLAARVAGYFGGPQDIEGAITADGQVMLVQARPVVYPAPHQPDPGGGKRIFWGNSNLTEGFPGVSCALTYSVAAQYGELSFTDFYRRMGVPARLLAARRHDLQRLLGHLRGRMYYRLDTWYALHSQIPSFAALRATWEQSMGLPPEVATPELGRTGPAAGKLRRAAHYAGIAARLPRHRVQVRQFLAWWDDYYDRFSREAVSGRAPADLVEDYHRLWAEVGEHWGIGSVNNYYLLLTGRLANSLVRRWLPGTTPGMLTGMLCGARENRSVAAIRSALALSELAGRSAPLTSVLGQQDDELVWDALTAAGYGEDIAAAALEHVRRYGDRSLQDLKMESVTIRQEPWRLLQLVRAYAHESLTVDGNRAQERQTRAKAESQLRDRCQNPARRAVLRGCYAVMREMLGAREDMRFCRSQLFGVSRAMLLELGRRLVKAGVLDTERDVLDLTAAEVLGAFSGTLPGPGLSELASLRRAQRQAWASEPDLPPLLRTDADAPLTTVSTGAEPPQAQADAPAGRQLAGIASSPGRVRGRAKVISDPDIDASECNDRILVARETDPGWLFLMMAARGIVVERGSPVSHTAITGRMLAIPTVVAVPGATRLIRDGDWIELDGTAGTVTLSGPGGDG
jgi:phosphohistidine swiveling domain-containing protein